MEKTGFTLAEVLITLAVIGVVAALTIPAVVKNYTETALKTQLKKSYSSLNQAFNNTLLEFGGTVECYHGSITSASTDCSAFSPKFLEKLRVIKTCEGDTVAKGCLPKYSSYGTGGVDGNDCTTGFTEATVRGGKAWILADGSVVFRTSSWNSWSGWIYAVDINGIKPPNRPGYDLFGFLFYKNQTKNAYVIGSHSCVPYEAGGGYLNDALKKAYSK